MNWTYSGRPGYDLHDALACEVIEEAAGIQRNCTVLRKTRP